MPKTSKAKKLVLVLATSAFVTSASKEAQIVQKVIALVQVPCIYYLVQFQKNKGKSNVLALINLGSKVNPMTSAYAKQLDVQVRKTDVKA